MHPTFKKILLSVGAVHLAGLTLAACWGFMTPTPVVPQKIAVRTVVLRENTIPKLEAPQLIAEEVLAAIPPKEEIIPDEESLPPEEIKRENIIKEQLKKKASPPKEKKNEKKEPPPPSDNTKPKDNKNAKDKKKVSKTKAQTKKEAEQKLKDQAAQQQEIENQKEKEALEKKREAIRRALQQAKDKLNRATPSTASSKKEIAIALPGEIESLSVETLVKGAHGKDAGYVDTLVFSLKNQLLLPERGDVELSLKLERPGKFVEMSIIKSQSATNRKYVEKKLPSLSYPSFGSYFEGKDNYTFEITLKGR